MKKLAVVALLIVTYVSTVDATWRLLRNRRAAEACQLSLYCPPMRIVATDLKHRRADAEPMVATFTMADGTKLVVKDVVIPATVVDRIAIGRWRVRACVGATKPGSFPAVRVELPPEDVIVRYDPVEKEIAAFAQPIDCPTTLTLADGRTYVGSTHFGECEADIVSITTNVAEAITATGTLTRR